MQLLFKQVGEEQRGARAGCC